MKKSKNKLKNQLKTKEYTTYQNLWDVAKSTKREVQSNISLTQEKRKISNNLTLHLKVQKNKNIAQNQYKEENNKDQSRNRD